ncbi:MAG: 3-deoxy-7-phosphoheptulonate synthase [Spirochaetaceae bacterium]|jgi:3-deoxy-7-phosphoheptulonate synthase|nr:3-deoxy-7-phosphoheptulonate synthase [Spirochaetaceae bacterium]
MIVVLTKDISPHDAEMVRSYLRDHGFNVRGQVFGDAALLGVDGKGQADIHELSLLPGVERVAATSKPYELASRETHAEDSIVSVGPVKIGGTRITVIAGPCAVESREQIEETAARVRESGAVMLRGGAYKPRTSPYAFQGLGMKGLEYMKAAGEAYNMPIVTEVVSPELAEQMKELTDMFQIGARNMQNFELLKKAGSLGKPVLLKRGPSATIEEWLLSAEYLLAAGTRDVVLCERGIRTFETYTRNTLDISAIPVVKALSHLPIIVDPSHAVGIRAKVSPAALAAIAAGADGLTVEVHPKPDAALSDGPQSLYPEQFERLMRDIEVLSHVVGKELLRTPRSAASVNAQARVGGAAAPAGGTPAPRKIAFSGASGAFAERAAIRAFGEDAERLRTESFGAVFDAVLEGRAAFGVVPLENSLAGSVYENYDLFMQYPDIAIAGEIKFRIVHSLIACEKASIDGIKIVRSHPQGFAQCKDFLEKHPDWKLEPWSNTASAVFSITEETDDEKRMSIAAIASEAAAQSHGLTALKTGIETDPRNYTRFAIISRKEGSVAPVPESMRMKPDKASLIFSVKDEPGSLYKCLKILSEEGINLSKLESRPLLGQPWNYLFYVDVSIPQNAQVFENALERLRAATGVFHFLGRYRASL